jgi:hypothetical protein
VAVWNFRGELVTSFEDHLLWHPDCNTNNIYITSDQDLIISYCKADSSDSSSEENGKMFFFSVGWRTYCVICHTVESGDVASCQLSVVLVSFDILLLYVHAPHLWH